MGYKDRVFEKINIMEQRVDERKALWQTVSDSFDKEGAGGATEELAGQLNVIVEKFDSILAKLDEML